MIGLARVGLLRAVVIVMAAGAIAASGVEVSVTITGDLDEIIPILELLRDMGIGTDTLGDTGEPLRLNMHSVSGIGGDEAAFQAVPPAPVDLEQPVPGPAPVTALSDVEFSPSPVAPGNEVLVTVAVADPEKQVDTLVAHVAKIAEDSFDLYDNGTHGDLVAADGIWSASITIPEGTTPGEYGTSVSAYNPHGEPVLHDDAAVTVTGNLVVSH